MKENYVAPWDQKKREFRAERNFNRNPSVKEHYINRWTLGPIPQTEMQEKIMDYWRKE